MCKESERAIRSATKELEQYGYLVRCRERNGNKYGHSVYAVYEIPELQNPAYIQSFDVPMTEQPIPEELLSDDES